MNGRGLHAATAEECGIETAQWTRVLQLCDDLTARGELPAVAVGVVCGDRCVGPFAFGKRRLADATPTLKPDDRFVVASLTKPVVAMGVLALVERGLLALNDRVSDYVPEYRDASKRPTTIRHLLTHTSGLPDALPDNVALRKAGAPLAEFVKGACEIALDFPPGRGVQYQSLGYALLGAIIQRISGRACGQFLKETFFDPLGMTATSIGAKETAEPENLVEIRVPQEMQGGDGWNWNSRYWREVGAPWGGLISTVGDLTRFCAMMLHDGELEGRRVLSARSVDMATWNNLHDFHDVPEADRRTRPWGYGWRLNWLAHPACFSDLLPAEVYGHWGATGTLLWIDPVHGNAAVILSSQPIERDRSPLIRISNAIAAAL